MILAILSNANYLVSWFCISYGQRNLFLLHFRVGGTALAVQASLPTRSGAASTIQGMGWNVSFVVAAGECSETPGWNPNGISNLLFTLQVTNCPRAWCIYVGVKELQIRHNYSFLTLLKSYICFCYFHSTGVFKRMFFVLLCRRGKGLWTIYLLFFIGLALLFLHVTCSGVTFEMLWDSLSIKLRYCVNDLCLQMHT